MLPIHVMLRQTCDLPLFHSAGFHSIGARALGLQGNIKVERSSSVAEPIAPVPGHPILAANSLPV